MYVNPFARKTPQEIYSLLSGEIASDIPLPRWPDPSTQAKFIARSGVPVVRLTQDYLDLMNRDGAFNSNWRGLDYGCGFGRFASLMLQYGSASHLELADPMPHVRDMIGDLGFQNKFHLVPQVLTDDTDIGDQFDFVFSYSVFTHFNRDPFEKNFNQLFSRLKPGGCLYITVSQEDFLDQFIGRWFPDNRQKKKEEFEQILQDDTFLFVPLIDAPTRREFWGRAFVKPDYLRNLAVNAQVDFLGDPDPSQKLYAIRK